MGSIWVISATSNTNRDTSDFGLDFRIFHLDASEIYF